MSQPEGAKRREKAARVKRMPEHESMLRPTFAGARDQWTGDSAEPERLLRWTVGHDESRDFESASSDGAGGLADIAFGKDFSRVPVHTSEHEGGHAAVSCALTPRRCPFGGACHSCPGRVQAKRDRHHLDQRTTQVPPLVSVVLRSPGQPLDSVARAYLEPRLGHDFGHVRVHTDAQAAESAREVNALAYTVGRHVVFGAGQYTPGDVIGNELLPHELTHVVQQKRSPYALEDIAIGPVHSPSEGEADQIGHSVARGQSVHPSVGASPVSVQRECVNGTWQREYDGCSVPPAVAFLIGAAHKDNPAGGSDTQFSNSAHTGPCDHHDECYQTCNPAPGAREKCDRQMYDEMLQVCRDSKADASTTLRCFKFAEIYYQGLKSFGGSAFAERQNQVCTCVGLTYGLKSDTEIRDWVAQQDAAKLGGIPANEKIRLINRLLDGWVSGADMDAIKKICQSVMSASEMQSIRSAISPRELDLTDIGQRTELRVAIGRL